MLRTILIPNSKNWYLLQVVIQQATLHIFYHTGKQYLRTQIQEVF